VEHFGCGAKSASRNKLPNWAFGGDVAT